MNVCRHFGKLENLEKILKNSDSLRHRYNFASIYIQTLYRSIERFNSSQSNFRQEDIVDVVDLPTLLSVDDADDC